MLKTLIVLEMVVDTNNQEIAKQQAIEHIQKMPECINIAIRFTDPIQWEIGHDS